MAFDHHRNKLRRHYEEDFSSTAFLEEYYHPDKDIPAWDLYFLRKLHETFRKGLINGGSCLEVGSGPTVHRLASASRVLDKLSYSDISVDNLRLLRHYRTEGGMSFKKFQHLFQHIAKLEGYENVVEGAMSIESRLKVKIQDVFRCDVLENKMMESKEMFDVIVSCGCIEMASVTFDDFIQCTKNIAKYLKPGGYLILCGYMGGNYFKLEDDVFPCLQFDLALVNRALRKAELEILDMGEDTLPKKDDYDHVTNCSKCFFSFSRKA